MKEAAYCSWICNQASSILIFKSLPQCKQDLFAVVSKCPTHPGTLKILKQLTGFPRGIHIPNSVLFTCHQKASQKKSDLL